MKKLNMTILLILLLKGSICFGQLDSSQVKSYTIFGDEQTFPLDSIIKTEIKNKKIIGYWEFYEVKERSAFKNEIKPSLVSLKSMQFDCNHTFTRNNDPNGIYYSDYWDLQGKTLLFYKKDRKDSLQIKNSDIPIHIKKLTKNKLIIQVDYFNNEEDLISNYVSEYFLIFRKRKEL